MQEIDLINKFTSEQIIFLEKKYSNILEFIPNNERLPLVLYYIDIAINYINKDHKDLSLNQKAMITLFIKKIAEKNNYDDDPIKIIDEIILNIKNNYDNHINNIAINKDQYYSDYSFILKILQTKWKNILNT
ncbi:MAG: hypothetical protein ACOC3V_00245 [bacterium]